MVGFPDPAKPGAVNRRHGQDSGLPDFGCYYFPVRAVNGAGVSEWSEHNKMNRQD